MYILNLVRISLDISQFPHIVYAHILCDLIIVRHVGKTVVGCLCIKIVYVHEHCTGRYYQLPRSVLLCLIVSDFIDRIPLIEKDRYTC